MITNWEMIHDQDCLKECLLQQNMTHFGQAHGTPYTIQPLNRLDWNSTSQEAESLLNGAVPAELETTNPFMTDILQHIANKEQLPEIDTYLSPEEVANGYKCRKESTSTSPSGCHLGLQRISAFPTTDKETKKIRTAILNVQTPIINIPLRQGFSPKRWQTVINAMLEKQPGNPLLHNLRVIHILEADYNLALKAIFVGWRLLRNCKTYRTLGDLQDGFRKGCSTTRTLLLNELLNDYNKRLRIDNFS
jgi:hypothetical protein